MKKFYVIGGEFTNTTFTKLFGKREVYGPFDTYKEAKEVWQKHSWLHVDQCNYRYTIEELNPIGLAWRIQLNQEDKDYKHG